MIGRQKNASRIEDSKAKLEADAPLQSMNVLIVTIPEGDDTATGLTLRILKNHFARACQLSIVMLVHRVPGYRHRLPKQNLPNVNGHIRMPVNILG